VDKSLVDSRKLFENKLPLLIVAPMQGVTDYAFRRTMEAVGGMDAFLSEYIVVANDDSYSKKEIKDVLKSKDDGYSKVPLIPQLISASATGALKVIRDFAEHGIYSMDVNMGCPTKSAINRKCGAWHSENPQEALALLKIIRKEIPLGLSVKTRIGSQSTAKFEELLEALNDSNCDFVTLHCRLATSGYHGEVFPALARHASQKLKVPLLYNGGVSDPEVVDQVCRETGARGLMVGRGIMQNPWLFKQVREFRETGKYSAPSKQEFLTFFNNLFDNYVDQDSGESGCVKRIKQLVTAFRHPGPEWGEYLIKVRRAENKSSLFENLANIDDSLLSSIGRATNQYFDDFLKPNI
jgi:tRNA-dihydrouridine synthase